MSVQENLFNNIVPISMNFYGDNIVYISGGIQKSISAILLKETFGTVFRDSILKDYDTIQIMIQSLDDTLGVTKPLLWARNGAGDSFYNSSISSGVQFYVHDVLEKNLGGYHKLYCTTSRMIPDNVN